MTLCRVLLVVSIVFVPGAGVWAGPRADDPDAEATGEPAPGADLTPAVHGPVAPGGPAGEPAAPRQTAAATGNNIIGLNVARLRRDRYIWAAAELVNANGGDWGYLTVVFTASERDSAQGEQLLQELLDRCYEAHLQPIVRVATSFDPETETWSRPGPDDPEKWRAFLERGRWPTKRVWVIAGNEPNLGREWGGEVDSAGYAEYLSRFLDVFADSPRFKVVNGPLDASNTTEMPKMQDAYEFLAGMEEAVPGIFSRLAGWASNPYSVPHQGPGLRYTHLAYESELEAIGRDMPVLITEAGHLNTGDEREIAAFYEQAFRDWMADPRVVAVTPLFWHPDRGVYWMFDFDKNNQVIDKSPTYELIQRLPRPRGSPLYEPDIENVPRGEPPAEARAEPRIAELALRPQAGELPPVAADVPLDPTPEPTATATPTPPPPTATPTATPVPPTATAASVPPAGMPATPTRPPATSTRPSATATPAPTAPPPAPTSAPAPASASARFMRIGNTDGGAVRMRSTPARSAPAIASVPTGTRVQALGTAERHEDLHWQRVRVPDGAEGWIPIDFLVPE